MQAWLGALDDDGPYHPKLFDAVREPGILVAHSGAEALVPGIAARTGAPRAAFVDALLPHPRPELATNGHLPPWNEWFPPGTIEDLLPGRRVRDELLAELPRVPLAYFAEPAPDADLPPSVYLQLSSAYDEQARQAAERGWPVERLDSHHLAPLTTPAEIATAL